jgi:hypothetical protein
LSLLDCISDMFNIVLHPYYRLDYIKMAWGSSEEQELKRSAGNPNAVDWHDEALKIVEKTMQDYSKPAPAGATTHPSSPGPINLNASTLATPETLGSEFDRHRCTLVEKAAYEQHSGWVAELCQYLNDISDNVSKDSDIIQWWSVSHSFISN